MDLTSNKYFIELCKIAAERNELCRRRTSIRNKLTALRAIKENIATNNTVDKLSWKASDSKFKKDMTKAMKVTEAYCDAMWSVGDIGAAQNARSRVSHVENILKNKQNDAHQSLLKIRGKKHVPKKYIGMPASEISMKILLLERDMALIHIEIAEFTQRTRKRLGELKKKLKADVKRAAYYNRIDSIKIGDQKFDRDDIDRIVNDAIFEEEILA